VHAADEAYRRERLSILFDRYCPKDCTQADFDLVLCHVCGMLFTNPRFSEDEIRIKYQEVERRELASDRHGVRPKLHREERAQRIFRLIEKHIHGLTKLRVLDYGGGDGMNLEPFSQAGHGTFLLDYVNYEPSKGIAYLGRDLEDLAPEARFDVILVIHTLEHATQPVKLLENLAAHLNDDGLVYLEVPLGAWREWKYLIEPLTHLNFFSEQSLAACLRAAGLGIAHVESAYQWVYYNRTWCLNAVASKGNALQEVNTRKTTDQLDHWSYYLRPVLDRPRLALQLALEWLGIRF